MTPCGCQTCRQGFGLVLGVRPKVSIGPTHVAALWLIGYEDVPERSSEICLFEFKGTNVRPSDAVVGFGLRPFDDQNMNNAFFEETFDLDVTKWHTWKVDWKPGVTRFSVDGREFKVLRQAPAYPMQIMLNLYDLAQPDLKRPRPEFWVDWIRAT